LLLFQPHRGGSGTRLGYDYQEWGSTILSLSVFSSLRGRHGEAIASPSSPITMAARTGSVPPMTVTPTHGATDPVVVPCPPLLSPLWVRTLSPDVDSKKQHSALPESFLADVMTKIINDQNRDRLRFKLFTTTSKRKTEGSLCETLFRFLFLLHPSLKQPSLPSAP
jgi:hypothetical protein